MTTIKTKTYTQDGVTAELWCYDSMKTRLRWEALFMEFKQDEVFLKTRIGANFACFVVNVQSMLFEGIEAEWAVSISAWWEANRALIDRCEFKRAWDAFANLEDDGLSIFVERAYERTRREYTPASEALRKDEADTQDEDFLADAVTA